MKKRPWYFVLLLGLVTVLSAPEVAAQACTGYYMLTDKSEYELLTFDRKDRQTGRMQYKVTSAKSTPSLTEATVQSKVFDDKDKMVTEGEYTVRCENGTVWIDMNAMVNPGMLAAYKDMEIKMQGDQIDYPSTLRAGQKLKDGSLTMDILDKESKQEISSMVMHVTDRQVGEKAAIKVPAGSYDSFKITQNMEMRSKAMGLNMPAMRMQTVEYFVPGVGMVRSESYRNGKLMAYTVLNKVSK